jgi:hypothetical protein
MDEVTYITIKIDEGKIEEVKFAETLTKAENLYTDILYHALPSAKVVTYKATEIFSNKKR